LVKLVVSLEGSLLDNSIASVNNLSATKFSVKIAYILTIALSESDGEF